MRTLCGIWFWEHCLVYSLARDLQGRFEEARRTLGLSQFPLLLPAASAVCPPATLFSLSQAGGGLTPYTRAGGISKEVLLALYICGDEKG